MKQLTMLALAFSIACSGSKDDSAAEDTAAGDDTSDTTDTTDTSDTSVEATIWGCGVASWGLCYDMYADEGWDAAGSEETCSAVAATYGVETAFINDDFGCPIDNTVGECDLPAGGDFTNPVTSFYDAGSFDAATAQAACEGANGTFFGE